MKLSENDLKVLHFLKENKRMRYSDLQNVLEISPAGLTKLLNKLLSLDLIKREVEQDRSTYYYLTKKGENILREIFYKRVLDNFIALMKFDHKEAKRLLDELVNQIGVRE